ncbi:unnamed protein product [Musa banksii]
MHARTDSGQTSIGSSSPRSQPLRHTRRPSLDGSVDMETLHANPVVITRSRSDRHSHSRQSSSSSSNWFSGLLMPDSWNMSPAVGTRSGDRRRRSSEGDKERNQAAMIEEERLLRGVEENEGVPYRCHVLRFVLAFFVLLSFFALVLWGASRTQKPRITMKSITFESFFVHAGVDASNVPTGMATLNSTVEFTYRNTGSFFAVDVTSTPLSLNYYGITVASGNMSHFHQSKQSQRVLNVVVMGKQVALYGGGPGVSGTGPVNMTLSFTVRSKAYVLGKVVKSKFHDDVRCSVVMDRTELGRAVSLKNSCR